MSISTTRNWILAVLIFTFMGAAWGWWPLLGFLQGLVAMLWLVALVIETFVPDR